MSQLHPRHRALPQAETGGSGKAWHRVLAIRNAQAAPGGAAACQLALRCGPTWVAVAHAGAGEVAENPPQGECRLRHICGNFQGRHPPNQCFHLR